MNKAISDVPFRLLYKSLNEPKEILSFLAISYYRTCKNSVVARFFPVGPANAHQNSGFHSKLIKST